MNLEDMYSNLPRSLKAEVFVRSRVIEDDEVLKKRQKLIETKKPAQLAEFQSVGDFPMPTALEGIFKPKAPKRKEKDEEKRK